MTFLISSVLFTSSAIVFLMLSIYMIKKDGWTPIVILNLFGNALYVIAYFYYVNAERELPTRESDIPIITAPLRRMLGRQ